MMNSDLNPNELLSLLEAFTAHRTQKHIAAGNAWPLDQAELLLAFRDWISVIGPGNARSMLHQGEQGRQFSIEERLERFKPPVVSLEESVTTLTRRINEALAEFRLNQPGSQATVTLSYNSAVRSGEQVTVELRLD